MADMKVMTLKVDVKDKDVKKLADTLDTVNVKTKDISVSAKDVADTYKNEFKDVLEYIALHMSKIGALVTEMNTHVGQAIEKNVEAGEKLAQSMEKAAENSLSVIEVKAIEASALMDAYISKVTNISKEQSAKLTEQVERNKEILKEYDEINKNYSEKEKETGILNLKAHKENIEERVAGLNKIKAEMEAAIVKTSIYYNALGSQYSHDSEEFKQVQKEKEEALQNLQNKILETNTTLKDSGSSYLEVWKKQHDEIKTKLSDFSKEEGALDKFFDKHTGDISETLTKYDEIKTKFTETIKGIETEEKLANQKKYDEKIKKLNKELADVRAEATKSEEEKKRLEDEQNAAQQKAEKYRADIKKIKQAFGIKDEQPQGQNENPVTDETASVAPMNETSEGNKQEGDKPKNDGVPPASDEEMEAARNRIDELDNLAKAEEAIVSDKAEKIQTANNAITQSNRSVLLEEMRIKDEQQKLKEEKDKKDAEIAAKAEQRKALFDKLDKVRAKAQLVVDIAQSTTQIAKGVAKAWGLGPIVGPPMAALVAIKGALELKRMTAQLAKFEDGGLLRGRRHTQGGMRIEGSNIEVEGGEYVVNRESTNKNLGLIRYINAERRELTPADINTFFSSKSRGYEPPFQKAFENGGQIPAIEANANINNEELIQAIRSIRIEPKVAVTDIYKMQDTMVSVDGWTGA